MKVDIMIGAKDRATEIALLLESLRNQTHQDFDVYILDDGSKVPLQNFHFLNCIIARLKIEGHKIKILRNNIPSGVSKMRQTLCDYVDENGTGELCMRVDDDVILNNDFIEKMIKGINEGYDLMSGITPPIMNPIQKRETRFVKPFINEVILDKEGNIVKNGDDCGYGYIEEEIIPAHHFRSTALYKKEVHKKADYKSRLSKHGFREEEIFSFKLLLAGYKIGVHTGAIAWHLLTPSGGERSTTNLSGFNENIFKETTKRMYEKHGNFIQHHNKDKYGIKTRLIDKEELLKSTNLR